MPVIEIEGIGKVSMGDEFTKLSPQQQDSTIQEIAKSHSSSRTSTEQPSLLGKALEPITSYPDTYSKMNQESRDLMGEGAKQAGEGGFGNAAIGAGKVVLGGLGYVTSPINAAIRTVVGKPVEENTGIPKEYTEFAAGMALPIPKRIPGLSPSTAKAAKTVVPSSEELFAASDKGYEAARGSGVKFAPDEVSSLSAKVQKTLADAGYEDFLAPKTYKALSLLDSDAPVDISRIDGVRKVLNRAGADPAEKDAVRRAVTEIDNFVSPKVPELAEARANYAAARRSETIQDTAEKAQNQAGSANSGANLDNATRQKFRAIVNSPKLSRGFAANELEAMKEIVNGSTEANAVRYAGNALGGGGGVMGTILGSATTYVAPVIGYGLKKLSGSLATNQVAKLDELVRSRSPLAKAVSSSVVDWSAAVKGLEDAPSIQNYARLTIATRNLSNNLRGVDIKIDPTEIIKSLQSPMKSAADPEQQPEPGIPGE